MMINKRYERLESEDDIQYAMRLIDILKTERPDDLEWSDIKELIGFEGNKDSIRKANDTKFGGYAIYNYCKEKMINNISDDEMLKEIEEQRLEFEKEKIKFQDQKREYRKLLRTDARFSHLKDEMVKAIDKLREVKPFLNSKNDTGYAYDEDIHAVAMFSDWHYGIAHESYWNKINKDICVERVNKLKNEIIKYCMANRVSVLHLEILGDLVNGLLHLGTRVSNEEDVISQAMHVRELISEVVNELDKYITEVQVYSDFGNHGRVSANKKESIDVENFERLIPWYLERSLQGKDNVTIHKNDFDDTIVVMNFLNETILGVHGDKDKFKNGVDRLIKMLRIHPTELHRGHNHSFAEEDGYGMTVTTNGTLSGVDDYAKELRLTGTPTQTLMMYNSDGRYCTYKIKL